jgi:NAD(P)-dependent dehydrogenase (short-subunit alcohol dehydrogenase family)
MLEGKHVVVIAGSSGIGAAVARQAAEKGARVLITGRDEERLKRAIASMPTGVESKSFDATDRTMVSEFFAQAGQIDHLVSCVGFTEQGSLLDHDEEGARKVFEHKFWAQLFIVRTAISQISRDGSITLTGGTSEDRAIVPHFSAFSVVANTAVGALVKGLAGEIAPVRINVVEPTLTQTALLGPITPAVEALLERFVKSSPAAKVPQPEDVARSYIYAMESGLANADRIRPDGGPSYSYW